ncbi:MAG: T9SS type A sorting domain-containing protein [Chitinophagaceae bacterium]|nr:T9SS type A sorting domain-containing protein [Chitinophagaceae bacterium]
MRKVYKISLGLIIALACSFSSIAQQNFFLNKSENAIQLNGNKRVIIPNKFQTIGLDYVGIKSFLWSLPSEKDVLNNYRQTPILAIPMPNGTVAKFNVWESSIQEPGLEAKFPSIKTFAGQGIDDPFASIRFDYGPRGFHAQVLTVNGTYYIDPYAVGDVDNYISYYRKDLAPKGTNWTCGVPDYTPTTNNFTAAACRGTELRTYRLAVACTGEYAQAPGISAGTNATILHNAIVTSVNRVVGVYRSEVAVSMTLVATNGNVEFLNAATDPFTGNNNANVLINESQTVCDNFIGTANYDIGHTFSTGGGGLAQLQSPCGGSKARGITGSPSPTGDAYDIDYVAHEMGHQFGGNHTMAGCGSSPNSTKLEVGSGTTIQAYAGICGAENIQPNSDPFFHGKSFDEISDFVLVGNGNTCGVITPTANQIPVVGTLSNNGANIPISTPFTLSGTATDPDGDPLTYCWEQWDFSGAVTWNAGATSPAGNTVPLFKSRIPKTTGSRTFPDIAVILAGYPASPASAMGGLKGETLSPVSRAMTFKFTVRDNKPNGGGVASSGSGGCQSSTPFQVNVIATSGPFAVTVPNGGESYPAGSTQTITWNTVGTENAPISCANVKISLSTDGGLTYPTVIVASTPNDGSEALTIPTVPATTTARVKIEAVGNIFFDISNANFNITAVSNGFDLGTPAPVSVACPAPASMAISLTTSQIGTFTNPISFVATGNPGGTTVSFSPTTVTAGNPTTVTLNNTNTLAPGSYPITVTASATGAANVVRTLTYTITPTAGPSITTQPVAQTICSGANASYTIAAATATAFQWQFSTDGGTNWSNVPAAAPYTGTTTATLTITGATATLNGYLYRCVASTQCGSSNSNSALLTVNTAPAITAQPNNAVICATSNTTFSVNATGTGLGYQWQVSTNGCAGPWTNIVNAAPYSGVNTATLTITGATAGMNNYGYQCVVTGTCSPSVTSNCGLLTIVTSVTVTTQPNNSTVCENAATSFTTAGSGTGVIYQWQVSTDGGANYSNLSNTAPYSGVATATLSVNPVTFTMNNYRYRCLLTNSTCTTPGISNGAILTVNTLPVLTSSPASQTICLNSNTSFTAAGTGTGLTYQWQVSTNGGGSWANLTNGAPYSGVTTATLNVTAAPASINTYQYRCVLSGTCTPAVNSGAATLTVINPVSITAQPVNATVCATLNTSFSVTAASSQTITYQWQLSTDGGANWSNVPAAAPYTGTTTATLNITGATVSLNNNRYRVLTNNVTCSATAPSNAAILTVNTLPVVTWPNALANQCANATTYALTGGLPAGGTYYGPGVTGTNFNASAAGVGTFTLRYKYTNANGCTDSIANTITVNPFPVLSLTAAPYTSLLPGYTTTISAAISPASAFTTIWSLNGSSINNSGNNTRVVDVNNLGTYTVVGTSAAGCISLPASIVIRDSASSKLFIYPTPNNGKFKVAYYNPGGASIKQGITIYSSLGKMVYNKIFDVTQPWQNHSIDLRNHGAGVYYVVVRNADGKKLATGEVLVK